MKEEQEYIQERRFQMAIERFKDYEEYMEIPGYGNDDEIESDSSNTIEHVDRSDEYIQERRFQMAIERFKDYEEYMEIPGYGNDDEIELDSSNTIERIESFDEYMEDTDFNKNPEPFLIPEIVEYRIILKNRFQAAVQRYEGISEYMEIPDMDLWMDLKKEIQEHRMVYTV